MKWLCNELSSELSSGPKFCLCLLAFCILYGLPAYSPASAFITPPNHKDKYSTFEWAWSQYYIPRANRHLPPVLAPIHHLSYHTLTEQGLLPDLSYGMRSSLVLFSSFDTAAHDVGVFINYGLIHAPDSRWRISIAPELTLPVLEQSAQPLWKYVRYSPSLSLGYSNENDFKQSYYWNLSVTPRFTPSAPIPTRTPYQIELQTGLALHPRLSIHSEWLIERNQYGFFPATEEQLPYSPYGLSLSAHDNSRLSFSVSTPFGCDAQRLSLGYFQSFNPSNTHRMKGVTLSLWQHF